MQPSPIFLDKTKSGKLPIFNHDCIRKSSFCRREAICVFKVLANSIADHIANAIVSDPIDGRLKITPPVLESSLHSYEKCAVNIKQQQ